MLFSYNQLIQAIPSPVFLLLQLLLLVIVDTTASLALDFVGRCSPGFCVSSLKYTANSYWRF